MLIVENITLNRMEDTMQRYHKYRLFTPCFMTPRHRKYYCAFLCFLLAAGLILLLTAWNRSAELTAHWQPDYEKQDITPLLEKSELSQTDYQTLYTQTGLSRSAVDTLRARNDNAAIIRQQDIFFRNTSFSCEPNSVISREEHLTDAQGGICRNAAIPVLENGDILITSASHTFGWRNGHAAIVVDASSRLTLESVVLGQNSCLQSVDKWETYPSFLILRLRDASEEQRSAIAADAKACLLDVPYGLLSVHKTCSAGQTPNHTHCAHLVWYAYKQAGYDLDSNGGFITTPRNIAESSLLEIVQVYGMRPLSDSNVYLS